MRLVADANVLLSAAIGGRARLVFGSPKVVEILTTEFTLEEVQEYAAYLATKKALSLDLVLLTIAALPVTVVQKAVYANAVPEATRRIGHRDPDDVDILALAIHLDLPVWSNDRDFDNTGVPWHTTASLLRKLAP